MSLLYKKPLKDKNSIELYSDDNLVFENNGKWLNPLFDLEGFLQDKNYPNLSLHDTAIG